MSDPFTERFSHTVGNYIKYRPGYPADLLEFTRVELGLHSRHIVADIGSGTGKLAALFLENGNKVFGVEPNAPMREAAEDLFSENERFVSVNGRAEHTGLPGNSVHYITAGQAFHWFDLAGFRKECCRILRPKGWVLLIWNNRADNESPFLQAYESFLQQYSTDYSVIDHRRIGPRQMDDFFGAGQYYYKKFDNAQLFDFEGLRGRYESCSYALPAGHPDYGEAIRRLKQLSGQYQKKGKVTMAYHTELYYGQVSGSKVI
jgi:SAM-dependent methyltransferase